MHRRKSAGRAPLIAAMLFLQAGCQWPHAAPEASISFTRIPSFAPGSTSKLDAIEGRATGAHPGQKIVLYARSGEWWVQPFKSQPFTTIQPDLSWKGRTHPGTAYAALLVEGGYQPAPKTDMLPQKSAHVSAVAEVQTGAPPPPAARSLLFAGYEWQIRQTSAFVAGTENAFSPSNAWTDSSGFLHLRISGSPNHWKSAEISLPRSLGYGSYRFVVQDLSHKEPSVVFTMMVFDETGPSREMDIEISKWGDPTSRNGQFVVQPFHIPANTVQFQTPTGLATFLLRWTPGRASFKILRGATAAWDDSPVREHVFTSGVPLPGRESVRMNLYVFGDNKNPLQQESEVVVEAFEYLP